MGSNWPSPPAGDGPWAVQTVGLWKRYGWVPALRDVNLRVGRGRRLVIVGPNGSGKSTLVKVLATLARPSAGMARVAGFDVRREAGEVRRQIGVVCHHTFLYGELTTRENLLFYAAMYGVPLSGQRVDRLLGLVGLEDRADVLVRSLSRGMQQRLALARALLHSPSVLLLDEPDTGLDQHWSEWLRGLVTDLAAQGCTIILTTHNLSRALDMADEVVVLNRGRIVFQASRDELDLAGLQEAYHRHTAAAA